MGLGHDEAKWKKTVKGNKRIGVSAVTSTNMPGVDNIDKELGNTDLSGWAAKRPKQGRRL